MSRAHVYLTPTERGSSAWQKVEEHVTTRLATYRAIAENPIQPEADRLGAAWRIKELKELLKLVSQPAETQQDAG